MLDWPCRIFFFRGGAGYLFIYLFIDGIYFNETGILCSYSHWKEKNRMSLISKTRWRQWELIYLVFSMLWSMYTSHTGPFPPAFSLLDSLQHHLVVQLLSSRLQYFQGKKNKKNKHTLSQSSRATRRRTSCLFRWLLTPLSLPPHTIPIINKASVIMLLYTFTLLSHITPTFCTAWIPCVSPSLPLSKVFT